MLLIGWQTVGAKGEGTKAAVAFAAEIRTEQELQTLRGILDIYKLLSGIGGGLLCLPYSLTVSGLGTGITDGLHIPASLNGSDIKGLCHYFGFLTGWSGSSYRHTGLIYAR